MTDGFSFLFTGLLFTDVWIQVWYWCQTADAKGSTPTNWCFTKGWVYWI